MAGSSNPESYALPQGRAHSEAASRVIVPLIRSVSLTSISMRVGPRGVLLPANVVPTFVKEQMHLRSSRQLIPDDADAPGVVECFEPRQFCARLEVV